MTLHDAEKYRLSLIQDLIFKVHIKKNAYMEAEDMNRLMELFCNLIGSRKFPFLVILDDFVQLSPEARGMISNSDRSAFKLAEAVVVHSLSQRLLIDFVFHNNDLPHSTKIFVREQSAIDWICQHVYPDSRVQLTA